MHTSGCRGKKLRRVDTDFAWRTVRVITPLSGALGFTHERKAPMAQRPIIVFDVNETLLDLENVGATFERIFHDSAAMRLWFANLITYSEALTLAGVYVPFTDIGGAVLRMLAATRGIRASDADVAELTDRFASMPPHPEVPAALQRLRDYGFRLFTLTDNTLEISGRQLEAAGLIDVFERRFSIDEAVRRHKPAPEAYQSVATTLEVDPGDICLIACHVWDTIGALAAGWQAGLILREGNAPLDVGPQPQYIGNDLDAIAEQLVERYPASASVVDSTPS
jgi:2-haloacid dehalogenase